MTAPPTLTYEPRCTICRSEHRLAIDEMLLDGVSQAEVRRHWNAQRHSDWLSASAVSRHARRHVDRRFRDISLLDELPFAPLGRHPKPRQRDVLDAMVNQGVAAINAGIVIVEPHDMLAAMKQENVTLRDARAALQRILRDVGLLAEAMQRQLPEHVLEAIYEEFLRLREADSDNGAQPG